MNTCPNLLLIGANARNAGKTTLACSLIGRYSGKQPLLALKIVRIKEGEEQFHGRHETADASAWLIREETDRNGTKDTSRMLQAGADACYYIQAGEDQMEAAFLHFMETIGKGKLVVCESRALRSYVIPGVFILMLREPAENPGKEILDYQQRADIISRKGNSLDEIHRISSEIEASENGWKLVRKQ